jgi:putative ABC transport system permease protein
MFDSDKWQEIIATLRKNKLRTFLTMCGVFWGIFMLIVMVGFGNGLHKGVSKNAMGFAVNSVYVWSQRTSMPYQGLQPGRRVPLTNEDVEAVKRRVANIEYLAPRMQLGGWRDGNNVTRGEKTGNFSVMGDLPAFQYIQPMNMQHGRFINDIDIEQRRKVAVIGEATYDVLFEPDENPIGKHIKVKGVYFQVVGMFKPLQSGERGERTSQTIFIPFTTFQRAFNQGNRIGWFSFTAKADSSAAELEEEVRRVLIDRHKVHPDDRNAFGSFNAAEEFGKWQMVFLAIKVLIWFVGIATLLAGVLGVSNIMLIVVKERTKEIGIRKALGATPRSIVSLVIQESITLTTVAGYLGLVAGVGVLELYGALAGGSDMLAPPTIEFEVAIIATIVLIVSGAIAGIIPARHAARVKPVEALRAE